MLYLLSYGDINQLFLTIVNTVEIFFLFAGLSVIITKNPIVSVLFLISLFLLVSIYLITVGIQFIGISYLLVYIGAVSILFLFILMLINVRVSELLSDTSNSIPLAVMIIIVFNYPINKILPNKLANINTFAGSDSNNSSINNNSIILATYFFKNSSKGY